jgi:hypothetical protein
MTQTITQVRADSAESVEQAKRVIARSVHSLRGPRQLRKQHWLSS